MNTNVKTAASLFKAARAAGRHALTEPEAKRALAASGLAVPRGVVLEPGQLFNPVPDPGQLFNPVPDPGQLFNPVPDPTRSPDPGPLSPPFAVKLVSPDASHKSDVGGVRLALGDAAAVNAAMRELESIAQARGLALDGLLVEEMAGPGVELVIGGLIDARFGPVVMVGLGGVFVEIFDDIAFRLCPIGRADAVEMIDELRAVPLLRGARGRAPVDEAAIVAALLAVGGERGFLTENAGEVAELDINPLIVSAAGATACDARIVLATEPRAPRSRVPVPDAYARFSPLFRPRVVAVAGASASGGVSLGNEFIRHSRSLGYDGRIVPVHPTAAVVEGLPAVKSLAEVGEPVDLAYIAVAARQVPALIASARGSVRFAQVTSSGFGETAAGRDLEQELVAAARDAGTRLLGPNCLGVYSPGGRLAFIGGGSAEEGTVGVVTQSG